MMITITPTIIINNTTPTNIQEMSILCSATERTKISVNSMQNKVY